LQQRKGEARDREYHQRYVEVLALWIGVRHPVTHYKPSVYVHLDVSRSLGRFE
jgi:hypothetical protein